MTTLAAFAVLCAILAAYVALIYRDRAIALEAEDDAALEAQRAVIRQQRAHLAHLQRSIDEYLAAIEPVLAEMAALERRNRALEARRFVWLHRGWQRRGARYPRLVWRGQKG